MLEKLSFCFYYVIFNYDKNRYLVRKCSLNKFTRKQNLRKKLIQFSIKVSFQRQKHHERYKNPKLVNGRFEIFCEHVLYTFRD